MAKSRFDDELSITKSVKSKTILEVGKTLIEAYIFPDVAKKIRDCLEANLKSGVYDEIDNAWKFALEINKVFQEIGNDRHLHFLYDPPNAKDIIAMQNLSEDEKNSFRKNACAQRDKPISDFTRLKFLKETLVI